MDRAVFMWVETRNICNALTFLLLFFYLCGGCKPSKFSHFSRYGTGAGNHLVKLVLKKKKGGEEQHKIKVKLKIVPTGLSTLGPS